jgi:hypothetical protein
MLKSLSIACAVYGPVHGAATRRWRHGGGWHRIATKLARRRADYSGVKSPFNRFTTNRRVEGLIRRGVGVNEATWKLPDPADAPGATALVDEVVAWVRRAMGEMRRPYGIDHVAVALACRDASGRVVCSNSLGVVRPAVFYGEDGAARVSDFLVDAARAGGKPGGEVVGAILSLGDIAYELGAAQAA